jgi:hypothetical protein
MALRTLEMTASGYAGLVETTPPFTWLSGGPHATARRQATAATPGNDRCTSDSSAADVVVVDVDVIVIVDVDGDGNVAVDDRA